MVCMCSVHTSQTPKFIFLVLPAFYFFVVCACICDVKPCVLICPKGSAWSRFSRRGGPSWLLLGCSSRRDGSAGSKLNWGLRTWPHPAFGFLGLCSRPRLSLSWGTAPSAVGAGLVLGAGPACRPWRKQVWSLMVSVAGGG